MRLNEETEIKINQQINKEIYANETKYHYKVGDVFGTDGILRNQMCVCSLDDLTTTIKQLETIRSIITKQTGVIF